MRVLDPSTPIRSHVRWRAALTALIIAVAALASGCMSVLLRLPEPSGVRRATPVGVRPVDGPIAWAQDPDAGVVGTTPHLDLRGYSLLVLESFTVASIGAGDNEDRRLSEEVLTVLRRKLLTAIQEAEVFAHVADADTEPAAADAGRVLRLHCRISRLSSGNRMARLLIGFDAGRTQLQLETRFVDARTGRLVLATADRWIASKGPLGGESRGFLLESVDELSRGLAAFARRASPRSGE